MILHDVLRTLVKMESLEIARSFSVEKDIEKLI